MPERPTWVVFSRIRRDRADGLVPASTTWENHLGGKFWLPTLDAFRTFAAQGNLNFLPGFLASVSSSTGVRP